MIDKFFDMLDNHLVDRKKTIFIDYYIDNIIGQIVKVDIMSE